MGLPMIQLVMIAARQVSKPIAEAVLTYGKNHPGFRNRLLIPMGRSLVHLTTRLRMKRLGLGAPTSVAQVSEAAALEQASDFVQQVVLFSYSVGVFAAYYVYTKYTSPETLKLELFEEYRSAVEKERAELLSRIQRLEDAVTKAKIKLPPIPVVIAEKAEGEAASSATAAASASATPTATALAHERFVLDSPSSESPLLSSDPPSPPPPPLLRPSPRFPLISSQPVDSAHRVVLEGEAYLLTRRGASLSIERGEIACSKRLQFSLPAAAAPSRGVLHAAESALHVIMGAAD